MDNQKKEKFTKEMYYVLLECFDNDLDSPENDVHLTDGIASAAKCQDLCKNYGDCNYFTHGSTAHPGKCWLKSKKATSLISHPGIIFGPKICGTKITSQNLYPNDIYIDIDHFIFIIRTLAAYCTSGTQDTTTRRPNFNTTSSAAHDSVTQTGQVSSR